MKKFTIKKFLGFALAGFLLLQSTATVNAVTVVSVEGIGKMYYSLTKSGKTVTASTSAKKASSKVKLRTKIAIKDYATGKSIYNDEITTGYGGILASIAYTKGTSTTRTCFATHEAFGNITAVAKYTSTTF